MAKYPGLINFFAGLILAGVISFLAWIVVQNAILSLSMVITYLFGSAVRAEKRADEYFDRYLEVIYPLYGKRRRDG